MREATAAGGHTSYCWARAPMSCYADTRWELCVCAYVLGVAWRRGWCGSASGDPIPYLTCLAVGQDGHVVAVDGALHEGGNLRVGLLLGGTWRQDAVELKGTGARAQGGDRDRAVAALHRTRLKRGKREGEGGCDVRITADRARFHCVAHRRSDILEIDDNSQGEGEGGCACGMRS